MTQFSPFVLHVNGPNDEDVYPIIYKNWLAVADGMGGSGCMEHRVDAKMRSSLRDVLDYVLPEQQEDDLYEEASALNDWSRANGDYLEHIFARCMKEEENTSARWASRIVMTRFLFFLILSERKGGFDPGKKKEVEALRDFIVKGLVGTKKRLRLTVDNPDMSVLPTTFAALRYEDIPGGDECRVHAVWAGDSRCYVLDANGLRKLSADDEDEYKQLTNHFTADGHVELHSRAYRLKKPFVLLCASDGFFDAYDKYELPVEAKLLEDIFTATSTDDLRERLITRYERNLADDTSIAFVPVGYSDMADLCANLESRWDKIDKLFAQHMKYSSVMSIIRRPEAQVTGTICDRFTSKFGEIIRLIAGVYFSGGEDVLLTEAWRTAIETSIRNCKETLRNRLNEDKRVLGEEICRRLRERGYAACFRDRIAARIPEWLAALRNCTVELEREQARSEQLTNESRQEKRKREELRQEIIKRRNVLLDDMGRTFEEADKAPLLSGPEDARALYGYRAAYHIAHDLAVLSKISCLLAEQGSADKLYNSDRKAYNALTSSLDAVDEEKYNSEFANLLRRIEGSDSRFKTLREKLHAVDESLKEKRERLKQAYLEAEKHIVELFADYRSYFKDDLIAETRMTETLTREATPEEIRDEVTRRLIEHYAKDPAAQEKTLKAFKENPDRTTCADGLFPAGKLSDFRTFYRYRGAELSEEMTAYQNDLSAFCANQDSLLDCYEEPIEEPELPEEPEKSPFGTPEEDEKTETPEVPEKAEKNPFEAPEEDEKTESPETPEEPEKNPFETPAEDGKTETPEKAEAPEETPEKAAAADAPEGETEDAPEGEAEDPAKNKKED